MFPKPDRRKVHPISPIDRHIAPADFELLRGLADRVHSTGGRLVVVGGAVRDALLGQPPKDFDCEVFDITAAELEAAIGDAFAFDSVGRSFGVLKLKGHPVDLAIPRTESRIGDRHTDFEVRGDPGLSFADAARRRDFTINAISWDPLTGEVIDPVNGRDDLANRRLRHVSDAFAEDALRVLRAAQFIARFDLQPDPTTTDVCRQLVQDNLSPERIFEEWRKLIIRGKTPSAGLQFLRDANWIRFYPELAALIDCPQDPKWHPEGDVWTHTLHCLDAFADQRIGDEREDLIVGLAVLCHDLGKPATTEFIEGRWRSRGHDRAGVEPTRTFLARMTRETSLVEAVLPLVDAHMMPAELHKANAGTAAVRRLANRIGRLDRLARVVNADMDGRPPTPPGNRAATDWLLETAQKLQIARSAPRPIIRGRDILALGIAPGPTVGKYVNACFEAQLDGAFNTHPEGVVWLRSILNNEDLVQTHQADSSGNIS